MRNVILTILTILFYIGRTEGQTVNIDMIFVKGGTFTMGNAEEGEPTHSVTLSDFYISKYPVTQKQWKEVMGTDINEQLNKFEKEQMWRPPLVGEGDNYPMYYVSWNDVQDFIQKLNSMTGKKYRLPTEAEWEYAARGGVKSKGYKYAGSNDYDEVAWYKLNCGDSILELDHSGRAVFYSPHPVRDAKEERNNNGTHPVGTKKPNELGIYDMSGNVNEWVWDWYVEYSSAPQINPKGPSGGERRIIRGGSWQLLQTEVYQRLAYWPDIYESSMSGIGFRLVMPK